MHLYLWAEFPFGICLNVLFEILLLFPTNFWLFYWTSIVQSSSLVTKTYKWKGLMFSSLSRLSSSLVPRLTRCHGELTALRSFSVSGMPPGKFSIWPWFLSDYAYWVFHFVGFSVVCISFKFKFFTFSHLGSVSFTNFLPFSVYLDNIWKVFTGCQWWYDVFVFDSILVLQIIYLFWWIWTTFGRFFTRCQEWNNARVLIRICFLMFFLEE